jgi:3-oxoacyl-[acyl-carrier protein] reductase
MDKLRDKVAIVTGGARGIGGAIAAAFAAEGADVVIADRLGEDVAAPVVEQIEAAGRKALFVSTDVSDEEQVRAMVDRAYAELGDVDILVNNAGVVSSSSTSYRWPSSTVCSGSTCAASSSARGSCCRACWSEAAAT